MSRLKLSLRKTDVLLVVGEKRRPVGRREAMTLTTGNTSAVRRRIKTEFNIILKAVSGADYVIK